MLHFVDKIPILGPKPSILGLKSKTLRAQISIFCPKPPDFMPQTPIFNGQNPILGSKPQILCLKTLFLKLPNPFGVKFPLFPLKKIPNFHFSTPFWSPPSSFCPQSSLFEAPSSVLGPKMSFFQPKPHISDFWPLILGPFGFIWGHLGFWGGSFGVLWGHLSAGKAKPALNESPSPSAPGGGVNEP